MGKRLSETCAPSGQQVAANGGEFLGRTGTITTPHGEIQTPAFIAVGTKATVKSVLPEAVADLGAQAVLANAYHLYLQPGADVLDEAGGLGAFICGLCVEHYSRVFAAADALTVPPEEHEMGAPPWERMTDVELLAQLPLISASNDQGSAFLVEWVDLCRMRGLSWAAIGKALGTTRQTVWERFARKLDDLHRDRAVGQ